MKKKAVISPRNEYLMKNRQRVIASPRLSEKFPSLKTMSAELSYYDPTFPRRKNEIKYMFNLDHASSVIFIDCQNSECVHGGFDLSDILATGIALREVRISSELRCPGRCQTGHEIIPCGRRLYFKLTLSY